MDNDYITPQELKAEPYLGLGVYLADAFIIVGYWVIMSNFTSMIYAPLEIPYYIVNAAVPFFLTRKSAKNPGRRLFQSILFTFLADKKTKYHGLEIKQGGIELEEDYGINRD